MRITTWNINSVRLRAGLLPHLVKAHDPDVICLQETKVQDAQFPHEAFEELGYVHRHIHGQKAYNGVAILSRLPFAETGIVHWADKEDRRHCHVVMENGLEVHNFYIPAGGDEPNPDINEKFAHKLQFLDEMADWAKGRARDDLKAVLVGDFNIAPSENDVWSHKQLRNVVSHTETEIIRLAAVQRAGNFTDAIRAHLPEPEKIFTWWSYRSKDWRKGNRGRRLDHIWTTPALDAALGEVQVDVDARDWEKPSDHVPVTLQLKLEGL
jgi:exodeoxyribonuclease-3